MAYVNRIYEGINSELQRIGVPKEKSKSDEKKFLLRNENPDTQETLLKSSEKAYS